jgi:hypothetical protein
MDGREGEGHTWWMLIAGGGPDEDLDQRSVEQRREGIRHERRGVPVWRPVLRQPRHGRGLAWRPRHRGWPNAEVGRHGGQHGGGPAR